MHELGPVIEEARPSLTGDIRALVARLSPPHSQVLSPLLADLAQERVVDAPSLTRFLETYQAEILGPVELTAIQRAYQHAARHEIRELLDLDCQLGRDSRLTRFAAASQAVGRSHLRRLLALRDLRVVRRYWDAVEAGRASAWHPLVYGVKLSAFSIPVRQGLLYYGGQTLGGFLDAAANSLNLSASDRSCIAAAFESALPALVHQSLLHPTPPHVQVVGNRGS